MVTDGPGGTPDVCVVGAGAWGRAVAWLAARAGARVVVADDGAVSAAEVAAGMLGPWSEVDDGERDLHRLMVAAAAGWPTFSRLLADAAGTAESFHACGTVLVACRPGHRALVEDRLRVIGDHAGGTVPAVREGAAALRAREPGLGPSTTGGLVLDGEHQTDPRTMLTALRGAMAAVGVRVVPAARKVERDAAGRPRGIVLGGGVRVPCGAVVIAAGWSSGRVAERVPVRGVKGEVLVLGPRPGAPCPIRRVVRTPEVYLVPRPDGRVVLGATQDEAQDDTPTAGAAHDLLDEALHVVPGLRDMAVLEHRAGRRPATSDALPAVGPDETGLVWATGGFRHGVLLTPVAAAETVRRLAGAAPDPTWAPFAPDRFPERGGWR